MNKTQCIELFLAAHGFDEDVTVENFKHNAGDEGGLVTLWDVKATNPQFEITLEVKESLFEHVLDTLVQRMHYSKYFKNISETSFLNIQTNAWKYLSPCFKKKAQ